MDYGPEKIFKPLCGCFHAYEWNGQMETGGEVYSKCRIKRKKTENLERERKLKAWHNVK